MAGLVNVKLVLLRQAMQKFLIVIRGRSIRDHSHTARPVWRKRDTQRRDGPSNSPLFPSQPSTVPGFLL